MRRRNWLGMILKMLYGTSCLYYYYFYYVVMMMMAMVMVMPAVMLLAIPPELPVRSGAPSGAVPSSLSSPAFVCTTNASRRRRSSPSPRSSSSRTLASTALASKADILLGAYYLTGSDSYDSSGSCTTRAGFATTRRRRPEQRRRRRRSSCISSSSTPSSRSSSFFPLQVHSSSSSSSVDEEDVNNDSNSNKSMEKKQTNQLESEHEYDMVVIGAGASGLFGAGAATSLGAKTLLIDRAVVDVDVASVKEDSSTCCYEGQDAAATRSGSSDGGSSNSNNIGGDCTNAACVPSKAVRSVARMASSASESSAMTSVSASASWLQLARQHAATTVSKVRHREDPTEMVKRSSSSSSSSSSNKLLDIMICHSPPSGSGSGNGSEGGVKFISPYELQLNAGDVGTGGYVEQYLSNGSSSNSSSSKNDSPVTTTETTTGTATATATATTTQCPIRIRSKKFLIATGSGPHREPIIEQTARQVGIPVYNYRTILRTRTANISSSSSSNYNESSNGIWGILDDIDDDIDENDDEERDERGDCHNDDAVVSSRSSSSPPPHRSPINRRKSTSSKTIVIAGGGATALELGQSLARLCNKSVATTTTTTATSNRTSRVEPAKVRIYIVAPRLLDGEDSKLQDAACDILQSESGIDLSFSRGYRVDGCRLVENNNSSRSVELVNVSSSPSGNTSSNTTKTTIPNVDAIVVATGRQPGQDLASLQLDNAQVGWNETHGVFVKPSTLQSTTQSHIYACGDCAYPAAGCGNEDGSTSKPTQSRTATHAAWTGYHAVSNALLPKWLTFGSKSIHDVVPRVIYTDPELVSVGMTEQECIRKYGKSGFQQLYVSENNTDRSDIDSLERQTTSKIGFVELRATLVDGRVLGFTGCGPSASELANQMSVAITNKLTVRHIAKSLHSFPSYGYLLHRVALSMALRDIWGSLEACGPVGSLVAKPGRFITKCTLWFRKTYSRILKVTSMLLSNVRKQTVVRSTTPSKADTKQT